VARSLGIGLLAVLSLSAAQRSQTFTGVVSDDMCATGDHAVMRMGANDAECARACVSAHGAQYVLFDGTRAYVLSDQKTADTFAGQKVRVVGTLDAKSGRITVESITAAG
jgi:Protein of unknown function (DUF5818)